ncbi:MAG: Lrp/AsnC family transcriptional regulator [Methanocalculus sp. MSAO_Arc1]|uniref:Lrp/AsnC family transcriptional regulator n=1 Tax=Methanocalculus TaxID=71151 RepID=UPI000FEF2A30|nr:MULTISPECIES: Lrp/AsnC family transcriptional regulator [unclassified Methanocalculus]MCP1661642.1 DNA-binding Lrp family transcriptional regulator [Methanocalculus sp. AMF5]RQD81905.1 MAG: Lrp/AsnC family transcriptional regulator [Methanocalculus sp. MSAO_Arc1]
MDAKDREILQLLESDSRIPDEDLQTMLNLPAKEVRQRIDALEKAGILLKYSAVIDWKKAGVDDVMAVVEVKVSPESEFGYDRIANRVARFPEVRSLRLVTGSYDLQLIVTGRTMQEVSEFVSGHIASLDSIRGTVTHIVMKTYKEHGCELQRSEGVDRLPYSF